MDRQQILDKQKKHLFPCVANYYKEPVVIARGEGATVVDADGREYLDFFGGILTVSMGHCHAPITDAVVEQARVLQHTSTLYPNEWIARLAEKVAEVAPGELSQSFFTSSGTEADETAVLLARMYAGGAGDIIALRHCYSGRSQLMMNMTAHAPWRLVPSQVAGIKHAHAPYCYRCAMGLEYPSCDMRCARDLEELIATETCGRIAAFIAEPIQGVGGFITPPPEYFAVVAEIVRRHGGLFISDEVQTGWGRTGTYMNGIEHWGVTPDVVTYAKGMANGLPIGCTVTRPEIAAAMKGLSISTFGGNPLSSVAALATIETIEREGVVARAAELGARLRAGLEDLAGDHAWVGEVRGKGLMQAMELVADPASKAPAADKTLALMEAAKREGLLLGRGGLYGNVIRIAPPMLIEASHVDDALERLGHAMKHVD